MKRMIILRGISGSGKSTLAKQLVGESVNLEGCQVVSADHFYMKPDGRYAFDPEKKGEAMEACFRKAMHAIRRESDVIVDNTHTTSQEIAPFYLLGRASGYEVHIITLLVDVGVCARNIHGVSQEKLEHQNSKLLSSVCTENGTHIPAYWAVTQEIRDTRTLLFGPCTCGARTISREQRFCHACGNELSPLKKSKRKSLAVAAPIKVPDTDADKEEQVIAKLRCGL